MILIKNITVETAVSEKFTGHVLVRDGKIAKVSAAPIEGGNASVIDGTGKTLTPGFIDIHTHQGLLQGEIGPDGFDLNEKSDPVTPHLRAIDGFYPFDSGLMEAPSGGVTAINTCPGSMNVFPGMPALVKTYGTVADEMAVLPVSCLKISLGDNPKNMYGKKGKAPSTRMTTAAILREWFTKASLYSSNMKETDRPTDLKLHAIARALNGELTVHAHCHRADDIATAVRIGEEFGLKLLIVHATEGHLIKDFLVRKNLPLAVGPSFVYRNKPELKEMSFRTPGILSSAGLKVCLISDTYPSLRYFQSILCTAVKEGMDPGEALKAVTAYPAEIMGVQNRMGSVAEGYDADLLIWSGDPRDYSSNLEMTIINGNIVYTGK